MSIVCGVDASTLKRPNWVAWLDGEHFLLDTYIPTEKTPLPRLAVMPGEVTCFAFDAPQGLPLRGRTIRECDTKAGTPTRKLPSNRDELAGWRAYKGLIEVGVSVFWWVHDRGIATVAGLDAPADGRPAVVETYPRHVIKRLWPLLDIPSKRNAPLDYIDTIYSRLQKMGYKCRSVVRPTVDQTDAMLCAVAAGAYAASAGLPEGTVGAPPVADAPERVLREGYIVSI